MSAEHTVPANKPDDFSASALSQQYVDDGVVRSREKNLPLSRTEHDTHDTSKNDVMLSIGGGGDADVLEGMTRTTHKGDTSNRHKGLEALSESEKVCFDGKSLFENIASIHSVTRTPMKDSTLKVTAEMDADNILTASLADDTLTFPGAVTSTPLHVASSGDTASGIDNIIIETDNELTSSVANSTQTDPDYCDTLQVPILGYEDMEKRGRFTVFKLHVKRSSGESWFIFRRYNDFFRLNEKLKCLFPHFRLSLPPKRWFGDSFDKTFLDERMGGLEAFLNNVIVHRDVCHSEPVRNFLCLDDPPGPHDSLEESRALCGLLEEKVYDLQKQVQERDEALQLLQEELALLKGETDYLKSTFNNTLCSHCAQARLERSIQRAQRESPSSQQSESSLPEQDQVIATVINHAKPDSSGSDQIASIEKKASSDLHAVTDNVGRLKLHVDNNQNCPSSVSNSTQRPRHLNLPTS